MLNFLKMKKIFGIGLVALILGCANPDGYKIDVVLKGGEGKAFLEQRVGGASVPKDTAVFKNGVAVFKGKVEYPDLYILHMEGSDQRTILFVENAAFKITGKADSLQAVKITGSPVNDDYQSIRSELEKDNKVAMSKYQEYQAAAQAGDTVKASALMQEVQSLFNATEKKILGFVKNNPASWVTPLFLAQMEPSLSPEQLDSLLSGLDPKLSVTTAVIDLKERLNKVKKVAIGQIAPDFAQNDPSGNPVRLSDIYSKNEYTLIDFWAAWCGPCRQENPNVVAAYTTFKAKGFGIFGVSLDQDHDRWVKAIEDDKLVWTQVSDLKYWQNEAARNYAINSIPANFLVDKTGKIIARNLRGEELFKKLAELLP
jgi:peroxiredoxin